MFFLCFFGPPQFPIEIDMNQICLGKSLNIQKSSSGSVLFYFCYNKCKKNSIVLWGPIIPSQKEAWMFGECNKLIQVQGRSVKFMGFSGFFTLGLVMDVMAWVP